MMKNILTILLSSVIALFLVGCGNHNLDLSDQEMKNTYYTKVNMWYQDKSTRSEASSNALSQEEEVYSKYTIASTNYKLGTLLPINSKIKVTYLDRNKIYFEYNNQTVALVRTKHSKHVSLENIFKRTFSTQKISLTNYSAAKKQNILNGEIKLGMLKNELVLSRGYPPEHRTRSLDSDTWFYWKNNHNKIKLSFQGNTLISIKD